jgi:hypothetical protein
MIENLRATEVPLLKYVFPEIFEIVHRILSHEFVFDATYAPKLLEKEVASIIISYISYNVIDYDPDWVKHNAHNAIIFTQDFVALNTDLSGHNSLKSFLAAIIFQDPSNG